MILASLLWTLFKCLFGGIVLGLVIGYFMVREENGGDK